MAKLDLKQNDTPTLTDTIETESGEAVSLDGATVKLFMVDASTGDLIVNQPATIDDATLGKVSYQFAASETARAELHHAEWRVEFGTGEVQRFPRSGYLQIDIEEALGTAQAGEVDDQIITVDTINATSASLGQLTSNLDAGGNDITGVGKLSTDKLSTKEKPVYDVTQWGAVGDGSTDDRQAIQNAIDAASNDGGGTVYLPRGTFLISVGGQDVESTDYCLKAKSNVTLRGDGMNATMLETTTNDSSPIWCNAVTNFDVEHLGIEANYHTTPQPDDAKGEVMGIKIGARDDDTTACSDITIDSIYLTGARRHGIEASGGSVRGLIKNCLFDDASGDDDVSISGTDTGAGAKYWTVRDCWSINKVREGFWTAACFEAEDGAENVVFDSLYCNNPSYTGITIGKSHSQSPPVKNHHAVDCTVYKPGRSGFNITPSGTDQVTEGIHIERSEVIDAGNQGIHIGGGAGHLLRDVTLDLTIRGTGNHGINIAYEGEIEDLTIPSTTTIRGATDHSVRFAVPDSTNTLYRDAKIDGVSIDAPKDAVRFEGSSSNYAGHTLVQNCDIDLNGWDAVSTPNDNTIRQHVIARNNDHPSDASPVVPANPRKTMWYVDDGTNTGSGTMGKRMYDGSAWFDAWTA